MDDEWLFGELHDKFLGGFSHFGDNGRLGQAFQVVNLLLESFECVAKLVFLPVRDVGMGHVLRQIDDESHQALDCQSRICFLDERFHFGRNQVYFLLQQFGFLQSLENY